LAYNRNCPEGGGRRPPRRSRVSYSESRFKLRREGDRRGMVIIACGCPPRTRARPWRYRQLKGYPILRDGHHKKRVLKERTSSTRRSPPTWTSESSSTIPCSQRPTSWPHRREGHPRCDVHHPGAPQRARRGRIQARQDTAGAADLMLPEYSLDKISRRARTTTNPTRSRPSVHE
jgi:hypothetical protein